MEKEILGFIIESNLSPFSKSKSSIKQADSIFKTRDGKSIHNRLLTKISENFVFSETSNLWSCFPFSDSVSEIERRQKFFLSLE